MSKLTKSEQLFEDACKSFGIPCTRIKEGTTRAPDYEIKLGGHMVFAEVTQLDKNERDKKALEKAKLTGGAGSFAAADERVRAKIHDKNAQLKRWTKDKHPGILVLYSNTDLGDYDMEDLHAAMYGSEGVNFAVPEDEPGPFLHIGVSSVRDGRMTEGRHTSTSAVVSLRYPKGLGSTLYFYHNKFAKVPVNPDWVRGDSIHHYVSREQPDRPLPFWVEV